MRMTATETCIDIAPMTPGQKGQDILSAENGTIIIVGMSAGGSSEIHIEHTNGEVSIYKHHNKYKSRLAMVFIKGKK